MKKWFKWIYRYLFEIFVSKILMVYAFQLFVSFSVGDVKALFV